MIATAATFAAAAGWWALRRRPIRVEIAGGSMRPSLEAGEWAIALRGVEIRRGDVAVVEHPGRPGFEMVKRVLAVPGDVAPTGRTLGPDEYWVEGDAPGASTDSRTFGPVRRNHVKGAVRLVYWPFERRRRV
ncbi:MAG TPA: S26 family signal peptidase [Actinomycetota bacterium]|nr:S26 family signal peptidase [Actinomycetota bacterium]